MLESFIIICILLLAFKNWVSAETTPQNSDIERGPNQSLDDNWPFASKLGLVPSPFGDDDDFHDRSPFFQYLSAPSSHSPTMNVDGTPMLGDSGIDIHGNPFGVTDNGINTDISGDHFGSDSFSSHEF